MTEQWNAATEEVAQAMEDNLDELNPIFMMANSGARGSFKQIRQLAGMRGLMANPKGEIIERPIKANFMEGLSVLEYFISTHGARKGLADTALRTADSGYLTRRLVDVAQDVIVRIEDCKTKDFIEMPLRCRGRRAEPEPARPPRGEEVRDQARPRAAEAQPGRSTTPSSPRSPRRSRRRGRHGPGPLGAQVRGRDRGLPRLLRRARWRPARWSRSATRSGIIAAQSIGEPGTQLTMRTFHTGGVAGARHHPGSAARRRAVRGAQAEGPGADGRGRRQGRGRGDRQGHEGRRHRREGRGARLLVPAPGPAATSSDGDRVERGTQLNEGSLYPAELLDDPRPDRDRALPRRRGPEGLQGPGRRHQRQAHRADRAPDAEEGPGRLEGLDRRCCPASSRTGTSSKRSTRQVKDDGGTPAKAEEVILGITKASLATESFLSAASFQETTKVLTDAALEGKRDRLIGLKENVIIGKLIPAATGLKHYRRSRSSRSSRAQRPEEELLDEEELAAELGLAGGRRGGAELEGFGPSLRRGARGARLTEIEARERQRRGQRRRADRRPRLGQSADACADRSRGGSGRSTPAPARMAGRGQRTPGAQDGVAPAPARPESAAPAHARSRPQLASTGAAWRRRRERHPVRTGGRPARSSCVRHRLASGRHRLRCVHVGALSLAPLPAVQAVLAGGARHARPSWPSAPSAARWARHGWA